MEAFAGISIPGSPAHSPADDGERVHTAPDDSSLFNATSLNETVTGRSTLDVAAMAVSAPIPAAAPAAAPSEISLPGRVPLSASFAADITEGSVPLVVRFYDTSSGTGSQVVFWQWDFGDGSKSTLQNPVHTFNTVGFYNVTLTVSDGESSSSSWIRISVDSPDSLRLVTSGSRVTFQNGTRMYLRGSSFDEVWGTVNWCGIDNYGTVDDAVKQMKAWNYTVMRLYIMPELWQHSTIGTGLWAEGETDYPHLLDMVVDICRRNGMYLIIDWHGIGNIATGVNEYHIPVNMYEWDRPTDPNYDNATLFWHYVSDRYGKEPMVMFSLFNEPGGYITWDQWHTHAQSLTDIIRANSSNIILVSGVSYAYDISGALNNPVDGGNIIYETHIYPESAAAWGTWDERVGAVAEKYPAFLGEWGYDAGPAINHTYLLPLMYYANDKEFAGWASFGWSYWTGPGGQIASWKRYDYPLSGFGYFVKQAANGELQPLADFEYQGNNPVNFSDASRNADAWQWDFGDGSPVVTSRDVTHSFAPGTYTITLTAYNQWGSDTDSAIIKID